MPARFPVLLLCAFLTLGFALQEGTTWTFDDVPAGRPPPGFVFASSPHEATGKWVVVPDGSSAVLAHVEPRGAGTQLAVVEGTSVEDVVLSARVRFAGRAGAAGLVWRYGDRDNHFLVSLDLRAQEVRIYRTAGGTRTRLEDEDGLELNPQDWHLLKVEHRGTRIRVWINGVPVADARDRTRPAPGAIGVWSAGDSTVWFDDLRTEGPSAAADRRSRRN